MKYFLIITQNVRNNNNNNNKEIQQIFTFTLYYLFYFVSVFRLTSFYVILFQWNIEGGEDNDDDEEEEEVVNGPSMLDGNQIYKYTFFVYIRLYIIV